LVRAHSELTKTARHGAAQRRVGANHASNFELATECLRCTEAIAAFGPDMMALSL